MSLLSANRRQTLRRWCLKVQLAVLTVGEWFVRGVAALGTGAGEREPLIPSEYITSHYVEDPPNTGADGRRIGQGEHTIPHGREIRLAYEIDPDAGTLYVRREAFYDGEPLGDIQVETIDHDSETNEVWGPYRDIPDTDPRSYAEHHFYRAPDAELVDQFVMCLSRGEDTEDYPVNPVEIG
jgi:hypothetical protein